MGLLALAATATREASADEAPRAAKSWRLGPGVGAGIGLFSGDIVEPWLELGGLARWQTSSAYYLEGQLTLSYSAHSESKALDFDGDLDDDENTDDRTMFAALPRISFGLPFSRRFAVEASAFSGPAWTTLSSTQCGDHAKLGLAFGGGVGPALSLGSQNELELALQADVIFTPLERCTNSSEASFEAGLPPAPHRHPEDDGQFAFVLRAHYLF